MITVPATASHKTVVTRLQIIKRINSSYYETRRIYITEWKLNFQGITVFVQR
jgi:hypothetical protein